MLPMENGPEAYPGLEFTPPDGTVPSDEKEGDALVRWKKIGDKYTIIEFEGKPVAPEKVPMDRDQVEDRKDELKRRSWMADLDQIAQMNGD